MTARKTAPENVLRIDSTVPRQCYLITLLKWRLSMSFSFSFSFFFSFVTKIVFHAVLIVSSLSRLAVEVEAGRRTEEESETSLSLSLFSFSFVPAGCCGPWEADSHCCCADASCPLAFSMRTERCRRRCESVRRSGIIVGIVIGGGGSAARRDTFLTVTR